MNVYDMSKVRYCNINPNKRFRTLKVMYGSAQSLTQDSRDWVAEHSYWQDVSLSKNNALKLSQKPSIPIEEIVTMSYNGFDVDTKKMIVGEAYHLTYDDSQYELRKNSKNELVISEIG